MNSFACQLSFSPSRFSFFEIIFTLEQSACASMSADKVFHRIFTRSLYMFYNKSMHRSINNCSNEQKQLKGIAGIFLKQEISLRVKGLTHFPIEKPTQRKIKKKRSEKAHLYTFRIKMKNIANAERKKMQNKETNVWIYFSHSIFSTSLEYGNSFFSRKRDSFYLPCPLL